ncbi:MAG: hypothetical protein ABSF71_14750 [Terriglobia bacterium]|jgi:hypothetical protein
MNKKSLILLASIAVFVLALTQSSARAASAHKTLKVKLNYAGAGIVDDKHKIFVLLFDANPYTSTSLVDSTAAATPPVPAAGVCHILRRQSASGKNETITFNDLGVSPVYAAAFLDQSGHYDGVADPASGSPTGVYGKALDKAEPIKLDEGKTVEVVLGFDDSTKTP